MSLETRACENCGSVYELAGAPLAMRDDDRIFCKVCGSVLISWSGGYQWRATLVERKENHKRRDGEQGTDQTG